MKNTIAETLEKLVAVLDRTIDSIWAFGIKIAEQIKQLWEKFKNFLLADKEILLHSNMRNLLQELNRSLDHWDAEIHNNPGKIYGFLQNIGDLLQTRLLQDPSYGKEFSFLYTEDIRPEIEKAVSKLTIS